MIRQAHLSKGVMSIRIITNGLHDTNPTWDINKHASPLNRYCKEWVKQIHIYRYDKNMILRKGSVFQETSLLFRVFHYLILGNITLQDKKRRMFPRTLTQFHWQPALDTRRPGSLGARKITPLA